MAWEECNVHQSVPKIRSRTKKCYSNWPTWQVVEIKKEAKARKKRPPDERRERDNVKTLKTSENPGLCHPITELRDVKIVVINLLNSFRHDADY